MPDVQPSNLSSELAALSESDVAAFTSNLLAQLESQSVRNQLQLVQNLAASGDRGLEVLMRFLLDRRSMEVGLIDGSVHQALVQANTPKTQDFLQTYFSQGVVPLNSERGIDYAPLMRLLSQQDFQAADRVTLEKLCELAGELAVQRKWLYFTEVEKFPITDLQTIDILWQVYSEGKFGYSVQREIWLSMGKNWSKLWYQIGWKNGNNWTRYPQEFTWSLSAPRGHLPLSNQLRGVRVISALLMHPAWETEAP